MAADSSAPSEAAPGPVLVTPAAAIAVADEEETSYIATSDWPWIEETADETSDDSVLEDEEAVDLALSALGEDDFS